MLKSIHEQLQKENKRQNDDIIKWVPNKTPLNENSNEITQTGKQLEQLQDINEQHNNQEPYSRSMSIDEFDNKQTGHQ